MEQGEGSSLYSEQEFQEFVAGVKRIKKEKGEVYLVIGDQGPSKSEEEIKKAKPEWVSEARFGDDRFVFVDIVREKRSNGERVGLKADVDDLKFWKDLSSRLEGCFRVVIDDFALIADEVGRELSDNEEQARKKRKAVIDEIYNLLTTEGKLVLTSPFYGMEKGDLEDIGKKFQIWKSANPFVCYPGGRGAVYGGSTFKSTEWLLKRIYGGDVELLNGLSTDQRKVIGEAYTIYKDLFGGKDDPVALWRSLIEWRKSQRMGSEEPVYYRIKDGRAELSKYTQGEAMKEVWEGSKNLVDRIRLEIIPILYPWSERTMMDKAKRVVDKDGERWNGNYILVKEK